MLDEAGATDKMIVDEPARGLSEVEMAKHPSAIEKAKQVEEGEGA